jgi:type I restriction enzyme S subunit
MSYQTVKLGDVCEFLYGDGLTEAERRGGEFPVYGSNGIVGWHDRPLTKEPTIVVGRKGSIGEIHLSEMPCWPIDTTYYVQLKKKPCDLIWLYYTLLALDLTKLNKSAAVPGLNRNDAYEKEIPLLPLDEQKRIAAILSKADRLRRLRRYARELSDGYLGSVFLEMFGDPVSNPMGWDITSLGEICSLIRDGVHETPPYVPSGVPFITVKNIVTGRLDFQNTNFVSEEVHSELTSRVKPERGDILVSKDGTIGVPCVVDTDREFSIFVSVALLKPRRRIVDPIFLVQQIRSDAVQRQIRQGTKGIAIRHLHLEDFKRLIILLPPLKHQREFVRIIRKFERLRAQQQEAERQAEHLFQSLLHRAFRGEL